MTKKAAALLLAASLAVSVCATPVFAAEDMGSLPGTEATGTTGLTTKVVYNVTKGYTWSVPATIDFGKDAGTNGTRTVVTSLENGNGTSADQGIGSAPRVMVIKNVIAPGEVLSINMKSAVTDENGDLKFQVKNHPDASTPYESVRDYTVKINSMEIEGRSQPEYTNKDVKATGTDILQMGSSSSTGWAELTFELATTTDTTENAGTYTGNVVFIASAN